jgi:hypothetical protein
MTSLSEAAPMCRRDSLQLGSPNNCLPCPYKLEAAAFSVNSKIKLKRRKRIRKSANRRA